MRTRIMPTLLAACMTLAAGCSMEAQSERVNSIGQPVLPPSGCSDGELVTRTQGFWKNHAYVVKGEATGYSLVPLNLGSTLTIDKPADVADYLRISPRGDEQIILGHQLLAAKLNVAAFSIGDFEFADWEGDGLIETVDQLIATADELFDSGNAADRIKMATILDKLNNAGDSADLWFDPTCRREPASCD